MGERYLVTGAQLGMFQALSKANKPDEVKHLVDEIIDKQFIGQSEKGIEEDTKLVEPLFCCLK